MLGCALLKVRLREPLTCLELETAWALAKPPREREVSGPPPFPPRRLREERGFPGPPRGSNPLVRPEAASPRPGLGSGPFLSHLLLGLGSLRDRGEEGAPCPGTPSPPSNLLPSVWRVSGYPGPQFPPFSLPPALLGTVEGRNKVCSPAPAVGRWADRQRRGRQRGLGHALLRGLPSPSPPPPQSHPDFLTLPFCTQQWLKGLRALQDVFRLPDGYPRVGGSRRPCLGSDLHWARTCRHVPFLPPLQSCSESGDVNHLDGKSRNTFLSRWPFGKDFRAVPEMCWAFAAPPSNLCFFDCLLQVELPNVCMVPSEDEEIKPLTEYSSFPSDPLFIVNRHFLFMCS